LPTPSSTGSPSSSSGPTSPESEPRTRDGRLVPDLGALRIRPSDAAIIAEYCDGPADLLMRSQAEVSRWRGLGDPGGERIAKACARAGFPLGCVADTRVREEPRARGSPPLRPPDPEPGSPQQPSETLVMYQIRCDAERGRAQLAARMGGARG
jgi:hypothetical protein